MITRILFNRQCENIRGHEETEWGFRWMQQPTLFLKKKWVTKPKKHFCLLALFSSSPTVRYIIITRENQWSSSNSIYYLNYGSISNILHFLSDRINIMGYNSWIQQNCFSVILSFNINLVVSRPMSDNSSIIITS